MTVRVTVLNEVKTDDPGGGDWKLAFQWCRYVEVEEGNRYHGYRFIWYRPNGVCRRQGTSSAPLPQLD